MDPAIVAILSSSVLSVIISATIAAWTSSAARGDEYKNDYYKIILKKRVSVYETLETVIPKFLLFYVEDGKRYPQAFVSRESMGSANVELLACASHAIWLTDDLHGFLVQINEIVREAPKENLAFRNYSTDKYGELEALCRKVENCISRDMLTMHEVRKYLTNKNRQAGTAMTLVRKVRNWAFNSKAKSS